MLLLFVHITPGSRIEPLLPLLFVCYPTYRGRLSKSIAANFRFDLLLGNESFCSLSLSSSHFDVEYIIILEYVSLIECPIYYLKINCLPLTTIIRL